MASHLIEVLKQNSQESLIEALKQFNEQNKALTSFPDIPSDAKKEIFDALLEVLSANNSPQEVISRSLECLRILSRDKSGLEHLTKEEHISAILKHAKLLSPCATPSEDHPVIIEALKCLCNLVFNSHEALKRCSSSGCIEGIVNRMKIYKDPSLNHLIKLFDMKFLHLITALDATIRPKLRYDLHGFTYLIEVLDLTLRPAEESSGTGLSPESVDLCVEVLKVLFNTTITTDSLNEEEEAHFMRLASVLHDLLLCLVKNNDKRHELHSHVVHLLTVMPSESYEELMTPAEIKVTGENMEEVEFEGKSMAAIVVLLQFLKTQLNKGSGKCESIKADLCPILHSLCQITRSNRIIRKFCRLQVLPYLGEEVKKLPEEGEHLRNKLCKLFTHHIVEVKSLSAEFLFILCKENTARFIKYTGYGNAAGLLAQKGLMAGSSNHSAYSSESENSDTEDYLRLKENVNPVTGKWEYPESNVMDEMTEEQKEYLATDLINKIDKLHRRGVIQPVTISESGRPTVVESVAELVEKTKINEDSDSD